MAHILTEQLLRSNLPTNGTVLVLISVTTLMKAFVLRMTEDTTLKMMRTELTLITVLPTMTETQLETTSGSSSFNKMISKIQIWNYLLQELMEWIQQST